MNTPPSSGALSRRDALRLGALSLAGLAYSGPGRAFAQTKPPPAEAVIQIWMWGGPSHLDTFDPKPDAGHDYCGPFDKVIPTNVDGIQLGELFPKLAR
ncbi:MAG TPA: DUF1501 domain-containing protein, partial [Candidatus Hydrogenedentes bacterium]|nr:DUF1501 domain-containing protein [Candidatus Hydrogenedentota bacterium]